MKSTLLPPTQKISPKLNKRLNSDNTTIFVDNHININDRIIHIFNDIDSDIASTVIKGVQLMILKSKLEPIHIYINSFGGDVYSSFAIYDFLKSQLETPIVTYNIGCAMSGGSIIMMAGDERVMYENSTLMLHSVSTNTDGKLFNQKTDTEECERLYAMMCKIYAKHSHKDEAYWKRVLQYQDRYYSTEDALELGLIDKIIP